LHGASVGIVPKPAEQSGDTIRIVEDLDVLGSEFKIVLVDGSNLLAGGFRIAALALFVPEVGSKRRGRI